MKEPYLACSKLTLSIYIVQGNKKYDVTDRAKSFVAAINAIEEKESQRKERKC